MYLGYDFHSTYTNKTGNMWMSNRDVPDSNFPNPAGAGLGQLCQKGPDAGPAGAEIRYIPNE